MVGEPSSSNAVSETASAPPEGREAERGFSRPRPRLRSSGRRGTRRTRDVSDLSDPSDLKDPKSSTDRARDAGPGPWLIFAAFFFVYTLLSVFRYERRESQSWDLGIFTQAVRQYAHLQAPIVDIRAQGLNILGDHFHPILMLLAPFFRVFPTPVTLLVAQAFLFAVAVVPITRTAMLLVGRGEGYAIGIAYGLSWGVVEAVNFDFHEIAFAAPLLAFSLCAYLRRDLGRAFWWALSLLLVKEDIALLAPMIIGMVLGESWRDRPAYRRAAIGWGVFAGWVVFLFLIKVVIPHFNSQHEYLYWGQGGCVDPKLHEGVGKLLSCFKTQELDGLGTKSRTVVLTLLPTMFLALRSPLALLAVPGFVMRFLTPDRAYWGTDYHYSAIATVILFVAAVDGLVRIRASRERPAVRARVREWEWPSWFRTIGDAQLRHGAAAMLAVGLALSQMFPLQDLWNSQTYKISDRAHALQHAEAVIPDDVTVETTISMLAPLAARTHAYWMGYANNLVAPEYMVFDLSRPDWNGADTALTFANLRHPGVGYTQIYKDPVLDVYVFRQTVSMP